MATQQPVDAGRDPGARRGNVFGWVWVFGIVLLFFGAWAYWAYFWRPRMNQPSAPPAPAPETRAAPLSDSLGKTVTVAGVVDRLIGQRSFVMAGSDTGGGNVLVVTRVVATPVPPPRVGERVQVKGKVEKFDLAAFSADSGGPLIDAARGVRPDEGLFQDFVGKPAVLADSVTGPTTAKPAQR